MSYGNYLQGSTDSTNNAYNLLISGAPSGYTSSGINIGGDTSTTYGVKITADSTHNAFMDVRGDASNKIAFRHKDQTSGTVTAMLDLTNDSALTGSGYGATVNGRVNASSYFVGSVDTRAPTSTGVYMGTDGNVGYFNINKGSGTGGFAFKTYNADGSLLQSNLNLKASGIVQASYYTATGNAADSEAVAVAGFDASGNIVRHYQSNARFRSIEARLTAAESEVNGPVSLKVNEVISRLNGLNFFSQNIQALPTVPAVPTTVSGRSATTSSATVTFTAGDNNATSFTVTASPGGITATGTASPITVTGLTLGTFYTFTVTATNSVGTSAASSASSSVEITAPIDIIYNIFNGGNAYMSNGSVWTFTNITNQSGNLGFIIYGSGDLTASSNITRTPTNDFGPPGFRLFIPANATFTITWNLPTSGSTVQFYGLGGPGFGVNYNLAFNSSGHFSHNISWLNPASYITSQFTISVSP